MDLFNAMRKAILTLTMILVKNDSELGEFIFFQQTICCAFACNNFPRRHLIYELRENLTNHEDIWQIPLIWQQLGCKTFQKQTECHPLSRVGNENLKSLISSHNDDRNGAAFREAEGTLGPIFAFFGSSFGGSSLMQEETVLHQKNCLE